MRDRSGFWLIVENILLHEAEIRHSAWLGERPPEDVASANEELWKSAKETMKVPECDEDAGPVIDRLLELVEAHRGSVASEPDDRTRTLWGILERFRTQTAGAADI